MLLTLRVHDAAAAGPAQDSEGTAASKTVELQEFPVIVGRSPQAGLVIDNDRISREHLIIEEARGKTPGLRWRDLGSRNGFTLNGRQRDTARVREGDVVEIGTLTLEVQALSIPEGEARESVVVASRSPRWLVALALPTIIVGLSALFGYWAVNTRTIPKNVAAVATPEELAEIEAFAQKLGSATRIDETLWREFRKLNSYWRRSAESPPTEWNEVYERVQQRRDFEFHAQALQLRHQEQSHFEEQQFSAFLAVVDGFEQEHAWTSDEKKWVSEYRDATLRRLSRARRSLLSELSFLLETASAEENQVAYERAVLGLRGTAELTPFKEGYQGLIRHWRNQGLVVANPSEPKVEVIAEPLQTTLVEMLRGPLRQGKGRGIDLDLAQEFGVQVIGVKDDHRWLLSRDDREWGIPFEQLTRSAQLRLASKLLSGGELLEAARWGYRWEQRASAEELLRQLVLEDPSMEGRVFACIAEGRGLQQVPDGGYSYEPTVGWSSRAELATRAYMVQFEKQMGEFDTRLDGDEYRDKFLGFAALLESEEIAPPVKQQVRAALVQRLLEHRAQWLDGLSKLERTFAQLRAVKEDLNQRRAKAIEVIMDAVIYLPEDHPDWRKGDVTNGQSRVDEEVNKVRELWEQRGRYRLALKPKDQSRVDQLFRLREEYLPKLRYSGELPASQLLAELSFNKRVDFDLGTYALNATERSEIDFNGEVRRYNVELTHPDLPEPDRKHVIFVNDYREMMGRVRCFIDVRLCRACKKHSAVCDAAGSIWHVGPDGSPGSRAKAEGFPTGVGENVAIGYGNPKEIWTRGWYRASDHHRNALASGWNCMGYGYSGQVGTQNFATLRPPFEEQETDTD